MPTPSPVTTKLESVYSSTQDVINSVQKDVDCIRQALPSISERQLAIQRLGGEVNELKGEVNFLRVQLQRAQENEQFLKRKIYYFEQREEAELIAQSIENNRQESMSQTKLKYVTYAPRTFSFSPNFNKFT